MQDARRFFLRPSRLCRLAQRCKMLAGCRRNQDFAATCSVIHRLGDLSKIDRRPRVSCTESQGNARCAKALQSCATMTCAKKKRIQTRSYGKAWFWQTPKLQARRATSSTFATCTWFTCSTPSAYSCVAQIIFFLDKWPVLLALDPRNANAPPRQPVLTSTTTFGYARLDSRRREQGSSENTEDSSSRVPQPRAVARSSPSSGRHARSSMLSALAPLSFSITSTPAVVLVATPATRSGCAMW